MREPYTDEQIGFLIQYGAELSTAELAKETCDYWNEMFEVSEEAREALTILSMRNN